MPRTPSVDRRRRVLKSLYVATPAADLDLGLRLALTLRAVSGAAHGRGEASVPDIQRRVAHVPRNQTRDGIALSPIRARVADRRHAAVPGERQQRRDPVHVSRGSGWHKKGQQQRQRDRQQRQSFQNLPPGSAAKLYDRERLPDCKRQ